MTKPMSRSCLPSDVARFVHGRIAAGAGKAERDVKPADHDMKLPKLSESIDEGAVRGVAEDASLEGAHRGVWTSRSAPWGDPAEGNGGRMT
jgi:hypothetical protein